MKTEQAVTDKLAIGLVSRMRYPLSGSTRVNFNAT